MDLYKQTLDQVDALYKDNQMPQQIEQNYQDGDSLDDFQKAQLEIHNQIKSLHKKDDIDDSQNDDSDNENQIDDDEEGNDYLNSEYTIQQPQLQKQNNFIQSKINGQRSLIKLRNVEDQLAHDLDQLESQQSDTSLIKNNKSPYRYAKLDQNQHDQIEQSEQQLEQDIYQIENSQQHFKILNKKQKNNVKDLQRLNNQREMIDSVLMDDKKSIKNEEQLKDERNKIVNQENKELKQIDDNENIEQIFDEEGQDALDDIKSQKQLILDLLNDTKSIETEMIQSKKHRNMKKNNEDDNEEQQVQSYDESQSLDDEDFLGLTPKKKKPTQQQKSNDLINKLIDDIDQDEQSDEE